MTSAETRATFELKMLSTILPFAVYTLSLHCEAQPFPAELAQSDKDVPLPAGTKDEQYMAVLRDVLPDVLHSVQPQLVFYNAGTDIHADDSLGKMALTNAGILARDRYVMKSCAEAGVAVAAAIGGGYEPDHSAIVERHVQLHKAASEYSSLIGANVAKRNNSKLPA